MIIAVDFDGTLCENCYPNIGKPNIRLINELILCRSMGNQLILWTCREECLLEDAVKWCGQFGLTFDAVNDNLEAIKCFYNHNSRKITADCYIDDKAVNVNETYVHQMSRNKGDIHYGIHHKATNKRS